MKAFFIWLSKVFFVTAFMAGIFCIVNYFTFQSPSYYKNVAANTDVYPKISQILPPILANDLYSKIDRNQITLTQADFESMISEVVTPDWVKSYFETSVDRYAQYLNGESSSATLEIDTYSFELKVLKSQREILNKKIDNFKKCSTSEEFFIVKNGTAGAKDLACLPSFTTKAKLKSNLAEMKPFGETKSISMNLLGTLNQQTVSAIQSYAADYRQTPIVISIAALLALIVMFILGYSNLSLIFKSLSSAIFWNSLLFLAIVAFFRFFLVPNMGNIFLTTFLPSDSLSVAREIAQIFLNPYLSLMTNALATVSIVSLSAFLIFQYICRKKNTSMGKNSTK
jgi:hypothetical protein